MHQRRSANYRPNLWKYDFLQSLNNSYDLKEGTKEQVERLVEEVKPTLSEAVNSLLKLELIDKMKKLGLSNLFGNEIKEVLQTVASTNNGVFNMEDHLYASALQFRLLRQHGHVVSQDALRSFRDGRNTLSGSNCGDVEAMIELLEASYLAMEGENILEEAKAFSTGILQERVSGLDGQLLKRAVHALELPMHWRVQWFDIKWQIDLYEQQEDKQSSLLQLAKLNFNIVQATHQRDLRDISRWWRDLGLIEHVDFARDRLVESFFCALGLSQEPQFSSFRKSLTKVIILILVIDDLYDLYGSLEELECFTDAITRWDLEQIQQLPECIKVCFQALRDVTYEIAHEIGKDEDWHQVAERERGDAPSSVACYMREANVSEDIARKHITILINQAWNSINAHCFGNAEKPFLRPFINVTVNAARVVHMLYQFGDGFAIPDGDIQRQILSIVIKPLALD
ncbi:(E,E)-alpha-farnesene synthase [Eucalyptus grandis]|uniref:(E,E)-alpha-farnesene synthase n=1 Tax=Eucalyptus grandis TaxID=71139 RepID=UPI00192ED805|nr:(E,E)-alpha-farnesene synthase [Eucalyptus grandis]